MYVAYTHNIVAGEGDEKGSTITIHGTYFTCYKQLILHNLYKAEACKLHRVFENWVGGDKRTEPWHIYGQ